MNNSSRPNLRKRGWLLRNQPRNRTKRLRIQMKLEHFSTPIRFRKRNSTTLWAVMKIWTLQIHNSKKRHMRLAKYPSMQSPKKKFSRWVKHGNLGAEDRYRKENQSLEPPKETFSQIVQIRKEPFSEDQRREIIIWKSRNFLESVLKTISKLWEVNKEGRVKEISGENDKISTEEPSQGLSVIENACKKWIIAGKIFL